MTRVIRVKDTTFEKLISLGKWSDTMDDIICKLITTQYVDHNSKKKFSPAKNLTAGEF